MAAGFEPLGDHASTPRRSSQIASSTVVALARMRAPLARTRASRARPAGRNES